MVKHWLLQTFGQTIQLKKYSSHVTHKVFCVNGQFDEEKTCWDHYWCGRNKSKTFEKSERCTSKRCVDFKWCPADSKFDENEKWRAENQSFFLTKLKSGKTTNLLCTFPCNFDRPLVRMATGRRQRVPLLHTKSFSRKTIFVFQFSCKLNCSHPTLFLRKIHRK